MWSKIINRSKTDEVRKESDPTVMIAAFFGKQEHVENYTVNRCCAAKLVVDVNGSIVLTDDDITEGELFFKIGKLSGDLLCQCRHIKQSVVPDELGGEIVFVQDEEELIRNKNQHNDNVSGGMELLTSKVPTVIDVRKNLESALTDCVSYGYDIDIDAIRTKIVNEQQHRDEYQLRIDVKKKDGKKDGVFQTDIFVTPDGQPLELQAVQKALYLAFIYHNEGIYLNDITIGFIDDLLSIYKQLPDKVIDGSDSSKSLYEQKDISVSTMNGYRSEIRDAIREQISNSNIVDLFAIEGFKNKPFYVQKSTPEIRELIRLTFGLPPNN